MISELGLSTGEGGIRVRVIELKEGLRDYRLRGLYGRDIREQII